MATKIINSKTNNYENEHNQDVVVEEYSPRSFLYSLRVGNGSQVNNVRQTIVINLDENGQSDVKNISLGNYGDNEVLYIQINSSSIEHDAQQYANYDPVLFIYKDEITQHIEASERGEGWSAFLVKQSNFTSAGNYKLIFGLVEKELATGNLADEYEIFLSNTITGKVADTRINSAYYKELENAPIIDEDYHNFIHKQPIVLSLADNKLVITSEPVNINKGDRYSTYIELLGAPEQLEEYFLIGCVNDQYCFYKFTNGADGTFKTWIPEEWTATDEKYNVWIVGRSGSKRYVSELFNFQANKTFLDQGYLDNKVMGTSAGEPVVSASDQKITLINTSALGGIYKLQYTGEEVQSLLDYVKNNVINQFYSKTEIDSKFAVVDGNISDVNSQVSNVRSELESLRSEFNNKIESIVTGEF